MPQVGQQDYKRVVFRGDNDMAAVYELVKAYKRGTIFDVVVNIRDKEFGRVVAVDDNRDDEIACGVATTDGVNEFSFLRYSDSQYEGLIAVQDATGTFGRVPILESDINDQLGVGGDGGTYICITDEDGNAYNVAYTDTGAPQILSVAKTTEKPSDEWDGNVVVPFDYVQKLVGLRISEF